MKVIISGGGTGGHIFPAIAIADALKAENPNIEILFVGAKGKMEMQKVPAAGYEIKGLNIAGFHRKQLSRNLTFPFKLLSSLWNAFMIVKGFKPNAVIGVGGYASGPTLKAASWLGIPTFLQEQNSFAGVTNKLLAQKAKKIFVDYEGMDKFFDGSKILISGNPVRREICENHATIDEAKSFFDIPLDSKVVLISGGSLGARSINEAIDSAYELIKANPNVYFFWQAGKLYLEEFMNRPIAQLPNVTIVDFIVDMAKAYAMAEVVVARAGALTISELKIVGKPVILVPSPNVAEDHQTHNAMALVNKHAALLVKDAEAKQMLGQQIIDLVNDENIKTTLSKSILQMAKVNAAKEIAKEVLIQVRN
jgi:UDP-N-acetylglucosamine--N-acetylmuramyl-(pentapeptide) pyrophosphoryl-undecaprenol N-acetylglucosamine transferase